MFTLNLFELLKPKKTQCKHVRSYNGSSSSQTDFKLNYSNEQFSVTGVPQCLKCLHLLKAYQKIGTSMPYNENYNNITLKCNI